MGLRNTLAFFILGVLNNASYVIMLACAKDIESGGVGVVYLADVVPCFLVKITSPFWFHRVPYTPRMTIAVIAMAAAYCTVGLSARLGYQLVGVGLCSFQTGLGEASLLALASRYEGRRALTAWASGTGLAGLAGYAWVVALRDGAGLGLRGTLLAALALPCCWALTYAVLLGPPPVEPAADPRSPVLSHDYIDNAFSVSIEETFDDDTDLLDGFEKEQKGPLGTRGGNKLSCGARVRFVFTLWPYLVPLILVYFAEYSMQAGVWSAIGFPVDAAAARRNFYSYANWTYQAGVFVSRSSGILFQASRKILWAMPVLQLALLCFFTTTAIVHFWYNYGLMVMCFAAGLLGGAVYVNTFTLINREVQESKRELALSTSSLGESIGTIGANITGLFLQACIYKYNQIDGAVVSCQI